MAGTVIVDTINSSVSGTPPVFQANGTQIGTLCRAWVNFNGTGTVAIRASFNVSSITDNGTGDYTVNFTNAMPDVNYATNVTTDTSAAGNYSNYSNTLFGQSSASAIRVISTNNSTAYSDVPRIAVAVFR